MSASLLSLNVSKTKFLTFSSVSRDQPHRSFVRLHLNNCDRFNTCSCPHIQKTNSIKYLGLELDENLRWKHHIEHIVSRLGRLTYKFYQIRNILSFRNLRVVYTSLAESVIRYCIVIWGGLFQESLKTLNVIQNTLLKILFKKNRRYSTEVLYRETTVMNVRQLYTYSCLMYIFETGKQGVESRNTRSCSNITVPFYRTTLLQRFVFFDGPKIFNSLPPEIKNINNKAKYKKEITKYILSNYNTITSYFTLKN